MHDERTTRAERCLRVTNRQALELLQQVAPYLRSYKAARAALALEHHVALTPRNGKYSAAQKRAKEEFETRFLATTKNDIPERTPTADDVQSGDTAIMIEIA